LSPGTHDAPAVHAPHAPLSHTSFVPHDEPLARLPSRSLHTGTPDEQAIDPVWHALSLGTHDAPVVHAPHAASSQTSFVPHDVPFGWLPPRSLHTGTPDEQAIDPVWHALSLGTHDAPVVHAPQAPLSQTSFVPQEVPLRRVLPRSVHVETPVAQEVVPPWHGLAGVHETLAAQTVHAPLSQTWPEEHVPLVPLGRLVSVSVHTETPPEQVVEPV
jgi:hypothetical protein